MDCTNINPAAFGDFCEGFDAESLLAGNLSSSDKRSVVPAVIVTAMVLVSVLVIA